MKKVLTLVGLFVLTGTGYCYQEVSDTLPGRDFIVSTSTLKSTGTVVGVSITTDTAVAVTTTSAVPGFKLKYTVIQNVSSDDYYCGHDSTLTATVTAGSPSGYKVSAGYTFTFPAHKEVFLYCISDGSAASVSPVGHYGYK